VGKEHPGSPSPSFLFRLTSSDLAYRYTALVGTSSTELDHGGSFDVERFGHRR